MAHRAEDLDPEGLLDMLERTDALRRPERFEHFLQACMADFHGRPGYEQRVFTPADRLRRALAIVQSLDAGAVARQAIDKADIPAAVRRARLTALGQQLASHD